MRVYPSSGDTLPTQGGNSGKYLTTDGSATSWGAVNSLPTQTGNSGKFLTTDGANASWGTVSTLPTQTGNSGKYLTTDGSNASWAGGIPNLDPTTNTIQIFDDFGGYQVNTTDGPFQIWSITSGTGALNGRGTPLSSETNRYGIRRTSAGSASGAYYNILASVQSIYLGNCAYSLAWSVKLTTVPDATNDYICNWGFNDNWPTFNNGVYIALDRTLHATNFVGVTKKGGVATTTNLGVAPANATWVNCRIEINAAATQVDFYINGTKVGTNTTNIPNNTVIGPSMIGRWVAGAGVNQDWDWLYMRYTPGSSRGTY